jgi:serine/threonine-protein kinase
LQLLKSYQLIRKIAAGGMAEVFLARTEGPRGFSKTLVLKRILPHLAEDEQFVEMFLSEARLVAQLNHPNVVQIFDFGEFEDSFYIAMEYIDGPNLRVLSRQAANMGVELAPALCAKMISYACEGLAYAHEFVDPQTGKPLGLVHRDVSSDNLLISRNGTLKVVDFGIAKVVGQGPRTKAGTIKGKLPYMPPEQIRGKPLDKRVDVFALGVVLYELLARRRPFDAKGEAAIMNAILYQTMKPIRQCRPDVPEELARIIERCLAKNRDERYANCRQLRADLERFIHHGGKPVGTEELASLVAKLVPKESESSSAAAGPASAMRVPAPVARSGMTPSSERRAASAAESSSSLSLLAPATGEAAPPVFPPRLTPVFVTAQSQPVPIASLELGLAPTTSRQMPRPARERTGLIVTLLGCLAGLAVVGVFFLTRSYAPQLRQELPPPVVELPREAEPVPQPEAQPEPPPTPDAQQASAPEPEASPESPAAEEPAPQAPPPEAPVAQEAAPSPPQAEVVAPAEESAPRVSKAEGVKKKRAPIVEKSVLLPAIPEEPPPEEAPEPLRSSEPPKPPESVEPPPAPALASVVFESSPPAQLRVNGQFAGFSPVTQSHLPPGPVRVEMYDSVRGFSKLQTFVLHPGDNGVHRLSVEQGTLVLHVQPATIGRLDGKLQGHTPLSPISLYEGKHELRLENPELGKVVVKSITIEPKQTLSFQYDLSSAP